GPQRVEGVVEVVAGEPRVEDDVVDALLDAGGPDVGELQERRRVRLGGGGGLCGGGRQDLDPALELHHEHAAVGQELDVGGQIEPGGEDLVLEVVDVIDVDGDRRRQGGVARGVARSGGEGVGAVGHHPRVPGEPVGCDRVL